MFFEQLLFTDDLEDEQINWIGDIIDKEKARLYFKSLIQNYK